ncbi:ATP-binding protein [Clostridium sp.]|uniref:sensor histidine kinase n=1 Tax=Clostridium sp. TaxID=1506 RepID=UPI0028474FE3|nr:ATP-binding protein [Clostridium sp.]MDR3598806.1 ATP-binding protein [Clostridium sp.]
MNNKRDLFSETRGYLRAFNSRIIITVLFLFIFLTSLVMAVSIYNEQKTELRDLVESEVVELQQRQVDEIDEIDSNSQYDSTYEMFFNYLIKSDGEVIVRDEISTTIRSQILNYISGWKPSEPQIKYNTIKSTDGKIRNILMVAQNVQLKQGQLGTVYVGKDVTYIWSIFQRAFWILLGFSLLFFVISILCSRFMTNKAMKPIIEAYDFQRQFVANASHELRTPLTVISAGLEVIKLEEKDKLSSFSCDVLEDLQKEVRDSTKLVNDLLFLAKTDTRELELIIESINVVNLIKQVVRKFQSYTEKQNIKISVKESREFNIYSDADRLKQLLNILVDNSIKYSPNGGNIYLSVGRELFMGEDSVWIKVTDQGIGISKEEQKNIFKRFYRVDKQRQYGISGAGLGLSIASEIISALSGTIEVVSEIGKGSTFIIWLPAVIKRI